MKFSLSSRLGACAALFGLLGLAILRHLVESNPYTYSSQDGRYLLLTVLIASGIAIFLRALDEQLSENDYLRAREARLNLLPDGSGQSAASTLSLTLPEIRSLTSFRQRRKPPDKLSLRASYFGLVGALFLAPLWVFFMALGHKTSYGLKVYLSRPVILASPDAVWKQRLLVQVDSQGHWYLDSQPIKSPYLESQIRKLVAHRAGRLVYLAVDRNAPYETAIHAVETLQQAWNARVVIVPEDMLNPRATTQAAKNPRRHGEFVP